MLPFALFVALFLAGALRAAGAGSWFFLQLGAQFLHFGADLAQLIEHGQLGRVGHFFCAQLAFLLVLGAVHGVDQNTDEQVQGGEGRNHHEQDEEDPRIRVHIHDRPDDAVRPAFQRHDLEQRIERPTQIGEVVVAIIAVAAVQGAAVELHPDDGEDVVDQQQQQRRRAHARQGAEQAGDHQPHRRDRCDQPQHPQHPQRAQHLERV